MSASGTFKFARIFAKTLFLLSLAAVAALPAPAQDTQPPVMTSFTFSPMSINTTTSSANVTITAQATDNLSGVGQMSMSFLSPSTAQETTTNLFLTSGSDLNGTWTGTVTFPVSAKRALGSLIT